MSGPNRQRLKIKYEKYTKITTTSDARDKQQKKRKKPSEELQNTVVSVARTHISHTEDNKRKKDCIFLVVVSAVVIITLKKQ